MTRSAWVVMAILLAALAGPALAATPHEQGTALFNSGDFEGALTAVDAGLRGQATGQTRASLHVLRARCLAALRRMNDVDSAIEAALVDDPLVTLDGLDVSPGFAATFERARVRLAGTVTVETEPPGGGVRIDGALLGSAPVSQVLPVGAHQVVILDDEGNQATSRRVVVAPRQRQTLVLPVTLKAAKGVTLLPPAPVDAGVVAVGAGEAHDDGGRSGDWPVTIALSVRPQVDLGGGFSFEAGAVALAKHWLVEVDGIAAAVGGLGLRAGGRWPLLRGLLALQLTVDGVLLFSHSTVPGFGGTFGVSVHPLPWLDLVLEGSGRWLNAESGYRKGYGLGGLAVRVRWPVTGDW